MKHAILDGETGDVIFVFDFEYDISRTYDYSEFKDTTSELMEEDLQEVFLKFFIDNQTHRIVLLKQVVKDFMLLTHHDSELIQSTVDEIRSEENIVKKS